MCNSSDKDILANETNDPPLKFELDLKGAVPRKIAEGICEPVFVDKETGEYAFHFLKLVMVATNGAKSEDIALLVRKIDSDEVAFTPAGVDHQQNEDKKYTHANIEKVGGNTGIDSNVNHVEILSNRSANHQQPKVSTNPNITRPQSTLSNPVISGGSATVAIST